MAAQLDAVEWGEFRIGDLFDIQTSKKRFDANKVTILESEKYPYVVRTAMNNGIRGYIDEDEQFLNEGNTISFGQDTATMFYQEKPYFTGDKIKVVKAKNNLLSKRNAQFFLPVMTKAFSTFAWGSSSFKVSIIENTKISLPVKNKEPYLDFMENFVSELEARRTAELEAYLSAAGLKDCTLTVAEEQALAKLKEGKKEFAPFSFDSVFNQIKQGRRLKKDDQISGSIPFVMAGVTNTGVVGYIANPVAQFPKNSITLDIFGNAFYRNYDYGAGDDTGAYWHDEQDFSKETMLFLTAAMQKAVSGKFSYGKKLRSSQSLKIKMQLPSLNGTPDYAFMQTLLSAVQKLVIRDVVEYADNKITATQTVIQQNGKEAV